MKLVKSLFVDAAKIPAQDKTGADLNLDSMSVENSSPREENDENQILTPTYWTSLSPIQMHTDQRFNRKIPATLNCSNIIQIPDFNESPNLTDVRLSQLTNECRSANIAKSKRNQIDRRQSKKKCNLFETNCFKQSLKKGVSCMQNFD